MKNDPLVRYHRIALWEAPESAELYIKNFHLLKNLNHWIRKQIKKKLSSSRKQKQKSEQKLKQKELCDVWLKGFFRAKRKKIDGFLTKIKLGPKQNTFNDNLWRWRSTKMLDFVWLYTHIANSVQCSHTHTEREPFIFVRSTFNSMLCFFCSVLFCCCCAAVLTQFSQCWFFFFHSLALLHCLPGFSHHPQIKSVEHDENRPV